MAMCARVRCQPSRGASVASRPQTTCSESRQAKPAVHLQRRRRALEPPGARCADPLFVLAALPFAELTGGPADRGRFQVDDLPSVDPGASRPAQANAPALRHRQRALKAFHDDRHEQQPFTVLRQVARRNFVGDRFDEDDPRIAYTESRAAHASAGQIFVLNLRHTEILFAAPQRGIQIPNDECQVVDPFEDRVPPLPGVGAPAPEHSMPSDDGRTGRNAVAASPVDWSSGTDLAARERLHDTTCFQTRQVTMIPNSRISAAITLLLSAAAVSGCAAQVAAAKRAEAETRGATEPCFGIARAGKNDCRTKAHVCAGWARRDRDPGAFIYVPDGTCERIVGGRREES